MDTWSNSGGYSPQMRTYFVPRTYVSVQNMESLLNCPPFSSSGATALLRMLSKGTGPLGFPPVVRCIVVYYIGEGREP